MIFTKCIGLIFLVHIQLTSSDTILKPYIQYQQIKITCAITLLAIASQLILIKSKKVSFRIKNKGIYTKRIRIRINKHKVKQGVSTAALSSRKSDDLTSNT